MDMFNLASEINADVKLTHVRGFFYIPNLRDTEDFLDAIRDTRKRTDEVVATYPAFDTDRNYDSFVRRGQPAIEACLLIGIMYM